MKVILLKDVKPHGKKGQVIEASDGYARNYLLPRKLAVAATTDNLNIAQQKVAADAAKVQRDKEAAGIVAERLASSPVRIVAKAGAGGRLFGAVTSKEISEALHDQYKIDIPKQKILLDEHIKQYGTYEIKAKLFSEVSGVIKVEVVEN